MEITKPLIYKEIWHFFQKKRSSYTPTPCLPFTVLWLQCFLLRKEPFCVMQDAWSCRGVSSGWHGRLWFDECYFEPPWFESSCLQNLSVCVLCMTLYILAQVVKAILKWTMLLSLRVKSLRRDVTVRILARVQQNGGEGRDWRVRKLQLVEHKVKERQTCCYREEDTETETKWCGRNAGTETRKQAENKRGIDSFRQLGRKLKPTVPFLKLKPREKWKNGFWEKRRKYSERAVRWRWAVCTRMCSNNSEEHEGACDWKINSHDCDSKPRSEWL